MHDGAAGESGDVGLPWERPVRQVTLAARADVIEEMRDPWKTYLGAIADAHDALKKIWEDDLESEWRGEAANAAYKYWSGLLREINDLKRHYDPMLGILHGTAGAVTDATHAIPIPIFAGNKLPGHREGDPPDGATLYDDYQDNRQEYADYAFRDQALKEAQEREVPQGVRVRRGHSYTTGHKPGSADAAAMTNPQVRKQAVETWYKTHQDTANRARDNLISDYAKARRQLPEAFSGFRQPGDSGDDGKGRDLGGHHLPGGGDGSGAAYGAGTLGAVGGAGVGAGAVHASLPQARQPALPSPPSSITDGIRLAGDTNPTVAGGIGPSGSSERLPLSWSTAGGSHVGGAGSFGAIGGGAGFGGVGGVAVPGTSTPSDGWWNRRRSGPMGPAATSPTAAERLAAGRAGTGAGTTGNTRGVGMMPGAGGAGNRQSDERYTWLAEDDEDIFAPKSTAPRTNGAGAIE